MMKGIADLLDSDMEESTNFIDENSILSSATDTTAVAKRTAQAARGKKRHRATMPPKSKSKVQKSTAPAKKTSSKQGAAAKRLAIADQVNDHDEEIDHTQGSDIESQGTSKKSAHATANKRALAKGTVNNESEDDLMEVEESAVVMSSKIAAGRTKKEAVKVSKASNKAKATIKSEAPQPARAGPSDVQEVGAEGLEDDEAVVPAPKPKPKIRESSKTRQEPQVRRRAGSASDTERGDPNLRRKLGDVTRKFENVDLKYRNLKEVGVNEANANMEKLRKQCDATMQASNDLIASLKEELAAQAPQAQEARKLKKQLLTQEGEVNRLRETATELSNTLNGAQNEIKALQAKLAAARASSVEHSNSRTPGSAIRNATQRPVMNGGAEASQAAQVAQMKEDLYSDLTGLIIRSVKKTEEGDTYDCIQTGRNGSKHDLIS